MSGSNNDLPWFPDSDTCITDVTFSNLLNTSIDTTLSRDVHADETEFQHQEFLDNEAVCDTVEDLVYNVEVAKDTKQQNLMDFSMMNDVTSKLDITFGGETEVQHNEHMKMIENLFKATEQYDTFPAEFSTKVAYSVTIPSNSNTLDIDTKQLYGFDTSLLNSSDEEISNNAGEDVDGSEEAHASKSSFKRLMNECPIPIMNTLAVKNKNSEENLDDSIKTNQSSNLDQGENNYDSVISFKLDCSTENNTSIINSSEVKDNSYIADENDEESEEANASKSSAKRLMNESIMSITNTLAAENKSSKENLEDSIRTNQSANLDETQGEHNYDSVISFKLDCSTENNTSMINSSEVKDISYIVDEDDEESEETNTSKSSAKRLMNESIMSIGDPMIAESKKSKMSLQDYIIEANQSPFPPEIQGEYNYDSVISFKLDCSTENNTSMINSSEVKDNSYIVDEDDEESEETNTSKSSAKRLMNESIMSIGDPMIAESKKSKMSLQDYIIEANQSPFPPEIQEKIHHDSVISFKSNYTTDDNIAMINSCETKESFYITGEFDNKTEGAQASESPVKRLINDLIMSFGNSIVAENKVSEVKLDDSLVEVNQSANPDNTHDKQSYNSIISFKSDDTAEEVAEEKENLELGNNKNSFSPSEQNYNEELMKKEQICHQLVETQKERDQQIVQLNAKLSQISLQLEEATQRPDLESIEIQTSIIEESFTAENRAELIEAKLECDNQILIMADMIKKLQDKLSESIMAHELLKEQSDSEKGRLQAISEELSSTQIQISSNEDKLAKFRQTQDNLLVEIGFLKSEYEAKKEEHVKIVESLEQTIESLHQGINQLKYKYELTLVNEHNDLKTRFDQLSAQFYEVQNENEKMKENVLEMDQQRSDLQKIVESNLAQIAQLTEQKNQAVTQLNLTKSDHQQEMTSLKTSLASEIDSLQDQIFVTSESATQLSDQLETAKRQIEELSFEKSQLKLEISDITTNVDKIQQEKAELFNDNSILSSRVGSLTEENIQKHKNIQELGAEIVDLKSKLADAEINKSQIVKEINKNHQVEIDALKKKNEKLEQSVQKFSSQKHALLDEKREMEVNLSNMAKANDNLKSKYERKVDDLKQQLAESNSEIVKMTEKNQLYKNRIESEMDKLSREKIILDEQIESMKNIETAKFGKHQKEIEKIQQEKTQLETDLEEMYSIVDQLKNDKEILVEKVEDLKCLNADSFAAIKTFLNCNSIPINPESTFLQHLDALSTELVSRQDKLNANENEMKVLQSALLESQVAKTKLLSQIEALQLEQAKTAKNQQQVTELTEMESVLKSEIQSLKTTCSKAKQLLKEYNEKYSIIKKQHSEYKTTIQNGCEKFKIVTEESNKLGNEINNLVEKIDRSKGETVKTIVIRNLFLTMVKRLKNISNHGNVFMLVQHKIDQQTATTSKITDTALVSNENIETEKLNKRPLNAVYPDKPLSSYPAKEIKEQKENASTK